MISLSKHQTLGIGPIVKRWIDFTRNLYQSNNDDETNAFYLEEAKEQVLEFSFVILSVWQFFIWYL